MPNSMSTLLRPATLWFTMFPLLSELFGMMMVRPCAVVSFVENICMSDTTPVYPCASIRSPTLYGLNSNISTPPAKFDSEPCNAMPIASPAAPSIAMNDVVSTPAIWSTEMSNSTFSMMFMSVLRKLRNDCSTLRFSMSFSVRRSSFLMIQNPAMSTTIASRSFGP